MNLQEINSKNYQLDLNLGSDNSSNIKNISQSTTFIITNILGAVLKNIHVQEKSSLVIDISDLDSGIYFISTNDGNITFSKKIIKM